MGKSTIPMAIFNSFLLVHQRVPPSPPARSWIFWAPEKARAEKEFAAPGHGSWTEPQEEDPWQGLVCQVTYGDLLRPPKFG